MSKKRALEKLLSCEYLTLSVYTSLPQQATAFRMNDEFPIFYLFDTSDNMRAFPPLRYVRYLEKFVPLKSINMSIEQYKDQLSVIEVFDFVLAAVKRYPDKIMGEGVLIEVLKKRPIGAEYYNFLGKKYMRPGKDGNAKFWSGDNTWLDCGPCTPNESLEDLICLESAINIMQANNLKR